MPDRNEAGELTSESTGGVAPTKGLIDHIRDLDKRTRAIEQKLWPHADGSGTDRYDHWTQTGDGTGYPGSYGIKTDGPIDPIKLGDSVRVIGADGKVDPTVRTVSGVIANGNVCVDGLVTEYTRDKVVRVAKPAVSDWTPTPPKR